MAHKYSTKKEVRDKILEVVRDQLVLSEGNEINDDTNLADDLGADTLDIVELTMILEEEFGISIPDSDSWEDETFGTLVRQVTERLTFDKED